MVSLSYRVKLKAHNLEMLVQPLCQMGTALLGVREDHLRLMKKSICLRVTIGVMKYHDQKQVGEERTHFSFYHEGS